MHGVTCTLRSAPGTNCIRRVQNRAERVETGMPKMPKGGRRKAEWSRNGTEISIVLRQTSTHTHTRHIVVTSRRASRSHEQQPDTCDNTRHRLKKIRSHPVITHTHCVTLESSLCSSSRALTARSRTTCNVSLSARARMAPHCPGLAGGHLGAVAAGRPASTR